MKQTRSILQSDFTMTKAKILETLEEKWNDIDRKAITYEVKHQADGVFGHVGWCCVLKTYLGGKKNGKKWVGMVFWIFNDI